MEANAVRTDPVRRAQDWPWSSLRADGPLDRPPRWLATVNESLAERPLAQARASVACGRPFGSDGRVRETADRLGPGFTLRDCGRPRKVEV